MTGETSNVHSREQIRHREAAPYDSRSLILCVNVRPSNLLQGFLFRLMYV